MVPIEGQLIARLGWHTALLALAALALLIAPLAFGLREPRARPRQRPARARASSRP